MTFLGLSAVSGPAALCCLQTREVTAYLPSPTSSSRGRKRTSMSPKPTTPRAGSLGSGLTRGPSPTWVPPCSPVLRDPAFAQVLKSLNKTYQNLKRKPVAVDLDPKAVTCDELFGIINPATREWKDGNRGSSPGTGCTGCGVTSGRPRPLTKPHAESVCGDVTEPSRPPGTQVWGPHPHGA